MEYQDGEFPWHLDVFDAHCHPTDTMSKVSEIPNMKARVLTVMATRAQDQELVASTASNLGIDAKTQTYATQWRSSTRIVPAFGWHPWFSHQMFDETDYAGSQQLDDEQKVQHYQSVLVPKSEDRDFILRLPDPQPFSHFLKQTKQYLTEDVSALVGEVGLDKAFRIPEAWLPETAESRNDALTPGGREGRKLSPYRVSMVHQKKLLKAQLRLAGEFNRAVSVHGVQVHGVLFDTLCEIWKGHERKVLSKRERKQLEQIKKLQANEPDSDANVSEEGTQSSQPYPPRICLHSYSGPVDQAKQYLDPKIPVELFFSFSEAINFDKPSSKAVDVIKMLPEDKILIESDLHIAGDIMDDQLEKIARRICRIRSWSLEEGVLKMADNYKRFAFGSKDVG